MNQFWTDNRAGRTTLGRSPRVSHSLDPLAVPLLVDHWHIGMRIVLSWQAGALALFHDWGLALPKIARYNR